MTSSTVTRVFSTNLPSVEVLDYNQASREKNPISSPQKEETRIVENKEEFSTN